MKVANAIYDVVFKYLLEDNKIAKLLISDLLGIEIRELTFLPQEYTKNISRQVITVYRVDFKAEIILPSGESLVVLIEIQKAKFTTDLMRFRKYLGEQYANPNNSIELGKDRLPIPIISIYFIGYGLQHYQNIPIIKVKRQYIDDYSNEVLEYKDLFIESLTHDSVIVQIPALKEKRRNDLEKALSIFEKGNNHEISINEDDYPDRYKDIIRRLLKAMSNEDLRKTIIINMREKGFSNNKIAEIFMKDIQIIEKIKK